MQHGRDQVTWNPGCDQESQGRISTITRYDTMQNVSKVFKTRAMAGEVDESRMETWWDVVKLDQSRGMLRTKESELIWI